MAETNIPPELQLKELLASYPKLTDLLPSSWFVWSDDPQIKPQSYIGKICHADMRYTPAGYDYLVTAVPNSDKTSLKYLRMLIHGPFKAFSDLIYLIKTKNSLYYLQCNDLKKWPANVLFNFCVASRVPIEFQNQLNGWATLLDEGYPEVLAFLLSHSTGGAPLATYRVYPEAGHHWFDSSADWKNIINGTPNLAGLTYSEFPMSVTPSNAIWGKSDDYIIIRKLDNVKAAEYFGFKFPDPKEIRDRALKDWSSAPKWLNEFQPQEAAQGLVNILHQAPNGAWAHGNPNAALIPAAPAAAINPFIHDDDEDLGDHDFQDWLNEDDAADD